MIIEDKNIDKVLDSVDFNKVGELSIQGFGEYLIELGLFKDELSLKHFVLDYTHKSLKDDDADLPITYLSNDEEISDEIVDVDADFLTDNIVEEMKNI